MRKKLSWLRWIPTPDERDQLVHHSKKDCELISVGVTGTCQTIAEGHHESARLGDAGGNCFLEGMWIFDQQHDLRFGWPSDHDIGYGIRK